jgi:hypothetical protein
MYQRQINPLLQRGRPARDDLFAARGGARCEVLFGAGLRVVRRGEQFVDLALGDEDPAEEVLLPLRDVPAPPRDLAPDQEVEPR